MANNKRLDMISDYARHGLRMRINCKQCGRVAVLNATEISMMCNKRGWSRDLYSVERRLRCSSCGGKDVRCSPAFAS